MQHIKKVAKKLNLKNLSFYGNNIAKIENYKTNSTPGKLVLLTSITPTSAGIGKTTVSIGLADALNLLKQKATLALREPSLGPVFGTKGGATGGGKSVVLPQEQINLHFTGDFNAISAANNLLCAMLDSHIHFANELDIDTNNIYINRCLDVNDRALRNISINTENGKFIRKEQLTITAASEIHTILTLAKNFSHLKQMLGSILVALSKSGKPIYAHQLKAVDSMAALLKDAINPNLVQTREGTPAIIHCGPFANISLGVNSVQATKLALGTSRYAITEAGFGSDLGAEKFVNIKCQLNNIYPDAIVLVATIPAIASHSEENDSTYSAGLENLKNHYSILKNNFSSPIIVCINKHTTDTKQQHQVVQTYLEKNNMNYSYADGFASGGSGCIPLAKKVIEACSTHSDNNKFTYNIEADTIAQKLNSLAKNVYGCKKVVLSETAKQQLKTITKLKLNNLPVVVAKTPFKINTGSELLIDSLQIRSGAGFILAVADKVFLIPGLSKNPNAHNIKIDENKNITNLK